METSRGRPKSPEHQADLLLRREGAEGVGLAKPWNVEDTEADRAQKRTAQHEAIRQFNHGRGHTAECEIHQLRIAQEAYELQRARFQHDKLISGILRLTAAGYIDAKDNAGLAESLGTTVKEIERAKKQLKYFRENSRELKALRAELDEVSLTPVIRSQTLSTARRGHNDDNPQ